MEFPEIHGTLLMASGEIINGEATKGAGSERLTGPEAVRTLTALSGLKDGLLHVYPMPADRVLLAASTLHSEIVFKGLSTEFTRLDRLIIKLKEEEHYGFIEILTKELEPMAILFFQDGEIADLYAISDGEASVIDRKAIPGYLENAVKQGIVFDVYRNQGTDTIHAPVPAERGGNPKEWITIFQDILTRLERLVDGGTKPGTFVKVFKNSLIEKSMEYPFLDPFGGEFAYRDGTVTFTGETLLKDFAKGTGDALQTTLNRLAGEFRKNRLFLLKLRAEQDASLERHREAMKRLGIDRLFAVQSQ